MPVFIARHFAGAARPREKRSTSAIPSSTMSKALKGAGIYAVWLNRRDIPNDTSIQPDAVISNLHELSDLIG